jgi:hypothetical protein
MRLRSAPIASALLASSLACGPTFDPGSLIKNERVLAVVAVPPEATPGLQVTLTPLVVSPEGTLAHGDGYDASWWRCPDSDSDALGDYAQCTVPEQRRPIGAGAPFVDTVPDDLFGDAAALADGDGIGAEKALGALLGYWRVVGFNARSGDRFVDAFKRVPIYLPVRLDAVDPRLGALDTRINADGELEPNTNPVLTSVLVRKDTPDGPAVTQLDKGGTYFFEPIIDERALQAYFSLKVDLAGLDLSDQEKLKDVPLDDLLARFERVQRCEIPVFNWYVTAGSLRRESTLDESVIARVFDPRGVPCPPVEGDVRAPEAEFTAPTGDEGDPVPDDGVVHAWAVLRDGRGGTAVRAFDMTIE